MINECRTIAREGKEGVEGGERGRCVEGGISLNLWCKVCVYKQWSETKVEFEKKNLLLEDRVEKEEEQNYYIKIVLIKLFQFYNIILKVINPLFFNPVAPLQSRFVNK